jgi:2-polyprenyl-3-methyl-5-hydroxy-6-metoxy-1,4-benzoquinol methylase
VVVLLHPLTQAVDSRREPQRCPTDGRRLVTQSLGRLTRKVLKRQRLDNLLDWIRFRIDSFPRTTRLRHLSHVHYQPSPILGMNDAGRAAGSASRWTAISGALDAAGIASGTALDIGANTGFFTMTLAHRGFAVVGVEPLPAAYRTAIYAVRKASLEETVGITVMTVTPQNIDLLPRADVVIFLSLWHHFVRFYGLDEATSMLEHIWAKTGRALFFETGESEMPESFGLPSMEPDSRAWLEQLLRAHCAGGTVEHLGSHQAFDADRRPAQRNLFVVSRDE